MERLYRSRKEKMIAGVCGGIAEYFKIDPVLIRVVFLLFLFAGGSAIIAYIIGMIIIPNKPFDLPEEKKISKAVPQERPSSQNNNALIFGIILIAVGSFFLLDRLHIPIFHDYIWWLKNNFWEFFIPGVLIFTGIAILIRSDRKK